jgi:hypothetical protein
MQEGRRLPLRAVPLTWVDETLKEYFAHL